MRTLLVGLLALGLVASATPAFAGEFVTTKPERVGLSSDRLERIGAVMEGYIGSGEIVGAMGLVARHGKVAYTDSWGFADGEREVPMEEDTIFRIYSMSKPITSVALMTLYEEGKFSLHDPIAKFLPEFSEMTVVVENEDAKNKPAFNIPTDGSTAEEPEELVYETEPARRPITMQDVFRHTAGLTYGFFGNSTSDKLYMQEQILSEDEPIADMVRDLAKLPLKHQPGTRYEYSVAVDVQGRLVEVLSGKPFDVYLQERLFEPLGMVDTGFHVPEEKMHRFAQMYSPEEDGEGLRVAEPELSENYMSPPQLHSGGGGLVSTAHDYLRFAQMMLNGGELDGERILSPKTVELMTADHLNGLPNSLYGRGYGFGLGFAVSQDLGKAGEPGSLGEYNWGGAAGTRFWIDPEEDLIGVYMVQIIPHSGLNYGREFRRLVYTSIVE